MLKYPFNALFQSDLVYALEFLWDNINNSIDIVYGIWLYKVLGIYQDYHRVKKIISFMHETMNRGKK